jgi:hypothetical protein
MVSGYTRPLLGSTIVLLLTGCGSPSALQLAVHQADSALTAQETKVLSLEDALWRERPEIRTYRRKWVRAWQRLNGLDDMERAARLAAPDIRKFSEARDRVRRAAYLLAVARKCEDEEESALIGKYFTESEQASIKKDVGLLVETVPAARGGRRRLAEFLSIPAVEQNDGTVFWARVCERLIPRRAEFESIIQREREASVLTREHIDRLVSSEFDFLEALAYMALEAVATPPALHAEWKTCGELQRQYTRAHQKQKEHEPRAVWVEVRDARWPRALDAGSVGEGP